ncbi:N-acylethanolamine-hydrolyzing acid amidase-like [Alosa sapidissima]|uniref:N-acylethanolamine-hydrolyzing acid amidase-like n=1 Tax=Alosa sapidissima TaxID=34773 RepID=UPI001C081738|nr:N-acylethanolamine-hydrolyzing acid amidase-like [Alosa sapidissima]
MAMVEVWVIMAAFCVAEASPPMLTVNLDVPPEERWAPLVELFDEHFLRQVAAEVIESTVPKWVHHAVIPIVNALEKYMPPPYAKEIQGMASYYGANIADIVLLNFAYEVTAFCSSIITQDSKGNIYHGRNLDYPHDVLRNITIDVSFIQNGKELYRGTTFAGYVGLWTGQSSKQFTVSGDQRSKGYWWENVIAAVMESAPASWLVRQTLEEAANFQDAVMRLSKVPLIADVYYIVGGIHPGEGVVITRDRRGPADIWPLDPLNGAWYRVETNYDHWLPTPSRDYRRAAATEALNATGQDQINFETLYKVLSVVPVCNRMTIYTTMMSAAEPENYKTVVRECMQWVNLSKLTD